VCTTNGCLVLAQAEANRTLCSGGINDAAVLGDDDFASGDETACGCASWLHEALPVATRFSSSDGLCDFGGTDGFDIAGLTARGAAFGEEREDGAFEGRVRHTGFVAAAIVAAVFDDVPILGPLLAPLEGMAAGLADLFFVRGDALGFVLTVGHRSLMPARAVQKSGDLELAQGRRDTIHLPCRAVEE
jgi:hypothetical protein